MRSDRVGESLLVQPHCHPDYCRGRMSSDPPDTAPLPHQVLFRSWPGAFPDSVCEAALEAFADYELEPAGVQQARGGVAINRNQRAASSLFIDPEHWVGALASHFALQANQVWGLDVVGLGTLTVIRYDAGDHFNWHIDTNAYRAMSYPGLGDELDRKVSVSVNLSDPADYDGGDMEFVNGLGQTALGPDLRTRGSVVVFPSTVGHRVTPVTRGSRYALVGWMVGPSLR